MRAFRIEFEEICYGVIEVYAKDEAEAREIAECEGNRLVNKSYIRLGNAEEIK
jgi:hypothetical protein